ncbi:hypothetical protein BZG36_04143, partial [Bifiguratus adelaidae]
MLAAYNRQLSRRPILVQSLSTSLLFAAGDIIAQQAVERRSQHDFSRTGRLGLFGGLVAGPALANWYRYLDRVIQMEPVKALFTRVALDQILFAPCFIGTFFTVQGAMEGQSLPQITQRLREGYPDALKNNYKLWPMVQIVNFYLVPLNHRLMVVNTIALGWNTYLSLLNQR